MHQSCTALIRRACEWESDSLEIGYASVAVAHQDHAYSCSMRYNCVHIMTGTVSLEEIKSFTKGVRWLISQQNRDGSWGVTSAQDTDRLVSTCQATTLLLDIGCSPTSKPIRSAIKFLTDKQWGDYAVGNTTSYWRIEPFSRIAFHNEQIMRICRMELAQLLRSVSEGRSHGHTFTLPLFALKGYKLLGEETKESDIDLIIEKAVASSWKGPVTCFSDRADMASMAIAWMGRYKWPNTLEKQRRGILSACKNYLVQKQSSNETGTSWEAAHVVRTAFVCINIAEAPQPDKDLSELMPGASKFLLTAQTKRGYWQPRPGERSPVIKSKEYYTAVALRGLAASAKVQGSDLITEGWSRQGLEYWDFLRRFTQLAGMLLVLLTFYFGSKICHTFHVSRYLEDAKISLYIFYVLGLLGAFSVIQALFLFVKNRI